MTKRNGVSSVRLAVTIDETTDRIIESMVGLGIHGRNRGQVASSILRLWIWENQDKLRASGIAFGRVSSSDGDPASEDQD